MDPNDETYGIEELAERGGVSRRTVRYYVQRGLLAGPEGQGRGARYSAAHLEALIRIRERQEAGASLELIAAELAGEASPRAPLEVAPPTQRTWTRIELADGLELHLRERRLGQAALAAMIEAVTRVIEEEDGR